MEWYERIRERREHLGMYQDELASKVGYKGKQSISMIEQGKNDCPQSMLWRICQALQVTPSYILDGMDEEESHLIYLYRNADDSAREFAREMLENHQKKDSTLSKEA